MKYINKNTYKNVIGVNMKYFILHHYYCMNFAYFYTEHIISTRGFVYVLIHIFFIAIWDQ